MALFQFGFYEVTAQREQLTAGRQTVTVTGGGTATADFELSLSPVHEEVTVTPSAVGAAATLQVFNTVTTIDSVEIAREAPSSIAEALENEPGIASRSFGPGASRPVIRGFGGDRVLIIEDGIRTGDLSATSDHHGMTIDPNSAERIEIVRGPATLLYGSSVVGGLINIITPHAAYRNLLTPPQSYGESLIDGTRAQLGTDAGSANQQAGAYANLQHSRGEMLYWVSGSRRRTGDYDTPEGPIFNSATDLTSARTGLGYFGNRAFVSGSLTFEDSRFGLPFEDRFHAHEEAGHEEDIAIDLASQRRVGRFDVGLRNLNNEFIQGVRSAFVAIDVADDHVETADGIDNIDTSFGNRTYITRTLFYQRQREHITGRFGMELQIRDFEAVGTEALAPRTDQTTLAAFGYEELSFGSNLNFYVYNVENFTFGEHTTEVVDNLRVLDIIQGDSRFVGFDARSSVRLGGQAWATLGIGYVNAKLTSTNEAVPRIPPLRATLSVDIPYGAFTVSPELMFAARQDRVFRDETGTAGYAVLNLGASYIWPRQHIAHVLSFTGYNLTNVLYRNHMSFIKDLAPEVGRGVKVGYSLRFF